MKKRKKKKSVSKKKPQRKRKPGRVHAICMRCYTGKLITMAQGTRAKVTLDFPHCADISCCFCGRNTNHGIFYRTTDKPERCSCWGNARRHRGYYYQPPLAKDQYKVVKRHFRYVSY